MSADARSEHSQKSLHEVATKLTLVIMGASLDFEGGFYGGEELWNGLVAENLGAFGDFNKEVAAVEAVLARAFDLESKAYHLFIDRLYCVQCHDDVCSQHHENKTADSTDVPEMDDPRDILIITADAVEDTGTVSFMFMIHADPERELPRMPQKYGFVWKQGDGYSFNVFEGGKGLVVGGGWTDSDTPEWEKKMCDALPSCTVLMNADLLPWWTSMAARNGIEFRHHHVHGILKTS